MSTYIYARVSTSEQDLDTQVDNLWTWTLDRFDVEDASVIRDTYTGANTDRNGFQELMEDARAGKVDRVVVREVTRIGRSMRDIHETIYELVEDHDVGLHVVDDNIHIEPGEEVDGQTHMLLSALGWAAQKEYEQMQNRIQAGLKASREAGKWDRRPPYGFSIGDDGYLVATEKYQNALGAIYAVDTLGWSHRKASRYSGVPRRTIPGILERKSLYLPEETYVSEEGYEFEVNIPDEYAIPDDELRDVHSGILELLETGSMPTETIVNTMIDRHDTDERDAGLALIELAARGDVEPHPDFDGCWRAPA